MSKLTDAVCEIDWKELRKQKSWLSHMAMDGEGRANGLLHLLDAIQDAAVDDGLIDSHTVFGFGSRDKKRPEGGAQ